MSRGPVKDQHVSKNGWRWAKNTLIQTVPTFDAQSRFIRQAAKYLRSAMKTS
ncbi:hypothetical protein BSU04_35995 [Caballeronia sordidicola]|uniref:Uncharacterized protein n=1 Tax=Caballeronia sordidicola TaxID=196367 RepID=A0A226WQX1_CABSO|nr:hypothetical protein BSU04_35995 [Caballeronia sordidicola]